MFVAFAVFIVACGGTHYVDARPAVLLDLTGVTVIVAAFLMIPLSSGVAVLRHRLWDVDLVIKRALVYGARSLCVFALYVLVVGYLGALFHTRGNLAVSVVAAGLVAVLFQPLRERLQRAVNRLLYGSATSREPYAVLSRLGQRFEAALAPEAVLPSITQTVREALTLPYAAIAVGRDGDYTVAAAEGPPAPAPPPPAAQQPGRGSGRSAPRSALRRRVVRSGRPPPAGGPHSPGRRRRPCRASHGRAPALAGAAVELRLHLLRHLVQRCAGRLGPRHGRGIRRDERLVVGRRDRQRREVLLAGASDVGEDLEVRRYAVVALEHVADHFLAEVVQLREVARSVQREVAHLTVLC